jgi:hypothetical protein
MPHSFDSKKAKRRIVADDNPSVFLGFIGNRHPAACAEFADRPCWVTPR